jgi:hypothetical protein
MLTTNELRSWGAWARKDVSRFSRSHGSRSARSSATIFLSHSHKDRDLIVGGGLWLNDFNVTIYVDWLDDDLPEVPDVRTASKIKAKIGEHAKFVLLATPNALESRWVPWELGIADVLKGSKHIAILPVADYRGNWHGNEYVRMYPVIWDMDDGGYGVFEPGQNSGGLPLPLWLML